MKKFIALVLCMLTLFAFSACSAPIYPGLPDISENPMKGIEIYCWQDGIDGSGASRERKQGQHT